MTINFRGAEINYLVTGKGEPTILLHGFLESLEIWNDLTIDFARYGMIISIDLPGHGKSGCIGEIHSMELMAEAVHAVLEELKIEKCNIIGHSMGGYVALAFLEKFPEKMDFLMLLNSHPQEDSAEKKELRERSLEVVRKNKRAYISMAISNLLPPEDRKLLEPQVEQLKQDAYQFSVEGITAALKGMKMRKDRTKLLKSFPGKKAIVAGKQDPLMDLSEIEKIARECNCRFFALPGGHLSYLESREEFKKLCISSKK